MSPARDQMPPLPDSCSDLRKCYWQQILRPPRMLGGYSPGPDIQLGYLVAYAETVLFTEGHLATFTQLGEIKHYPSRFLRHPFWIECHLPLPGYARRDFSVLGFRADYNEHPLLLHGETIEYKYDTSVGDWQLIFITKQGEVFLRLRKTIQFLQEWGVDHRKPCSMKACPVAIRGSDYAYMTELRCEACHTEERYWKQAAEAFLVAALVGAPSLKSQKKEPAEETRQASSPQPPAKKETRKPPVVVVHPLLLDRYVSQQESQRQQAIESADKYLWMHSAWTMTEALRPTMGAIDLLRLPSTNTYIELEQPHIVHEAQFAACSFLQLPAGTDSVQRKLYSILDIEGKAHWKMLYEYKDAKQPGRWALPQDYQCPVQQCGREQTPEGVIFHLCDRCQKRASHFTTWLAIALGMIAGDYQEQVELREPEEVIETSKKYVYDEQSGATIEKTVLRRFRVIRYYDACVQRHSSAPRSRRGSWMTNRPLAESEYDVNPDALIYVLIRPKDYDRTYLHQRFVNMYGKTQHIDPKRRLQPMTIARLRQLPQIQRITKVYASAYQEIA